MQTHETIELLSKSNLASNSYIAWVAPILEPSRLIGVSIGALTCFRIARTLAKSWRHSADAPTVADIAGSVEVTEGLGGLPKVVLTHSGGSKAEVSIPRCKGQEPGTRRDRKTLVIWKT
jgi:hypothetical protein